jgi:polysaccharide transporter, PST family
VNGDRVLTQSKFGAALVGAQRTLRTRTSRRILKNIAALSIAQTATYLLPLVVVPYTAVVLGPRGFGMIALTQAVVQYSTLVTNFGFSFSATRQAAVCQGDSQKLAEIVVNVWTAKCLLMLVCLITSVAIFAAVPALRPALGAYFCGFISVIGSVLYLDWFFQAIEEMKWITVINVIPKLALTPFIFLLVKVPSDYALVLLIQSATLLTSGIAGAILARRRLHVPLPAPSLRGLSAELKVGWSTFLATVSINLYTATSTVLLALMTNLTVVGYYSAGQKVVSGVQSLWTPISQSLYPHFCKSFRADPGRAARHLKQIALTVFAVTLAGASAICIASPRLVPLYLGPRFSNSVGVIQVLIFSVCAVATNNVLGIHGMLASGLHGDFLSMVSVAAAVSLLLVPLGILIAGHIGLAVVAVTIESFIGVYAYWLLRKRGIL